MLEVIDQRPAMIVDAECAEDVVASVNFAREHRLSLGVMATGHGIAAPCDGLLLRFTKMNQIAVDTTRNVATVGPGVISSELLRATEEHDLVYPAGQAGNVGVVGYALGGGIGWLVRKLGPAVDHLVGESGSLLGLARWWGQLWGRCLPRDRTHPVEERLRWRAILPTRACRRGTAFL